MAILTSLFSGISGLNSFGTGLTVVANNIANMNTVGFKDSDVVFADIISQTLSGAGGDYQIGRGGFVNTVRRQFTQGSFETTANGLDLAIEGDGFFVVKSPQGLQTFTRAGAFETDLNGNMVSPGGERVQGFLADSAGLLTGQIGDINISTAVSPPLPSTSVDIVANLNSADTIPPAFNVATPTTTSNFSTAITVFDSLGNSHLVTIYFRKNTAPITGNTWEWKAVVDASDSLSGTTEVQAEGLLTFNTSGALNLESAITYPLASNGFDFSGGATAGQVIVFDFGTNITAESGAGLDGVTQFGSASAVFNQIQDGHGSGSLASISIDELGVITGLFTNGQSRSMAQIVLARFNDNQGLNSIGGNLFAPSSGSGQAIIGAPDSAGLGKVRSNSLELSNVDLAQQFVKMIEFQRGFQASSRVITTTDEILQDLVNLKR